MLLKLLPLPLVYQRYVNIIVMLEGCPVVSMIGDFASVGAVPGMPLSLNQE